MPKKRKDDQNAYDGDNVTEISIDIEHNQKKNEPNDGHPSNSSKQDTTTNVRVVDEASRDKKAYVNSDGPDMLANAQPSSKNQDVIDDAKNKSKVIEIVGPTRDYSELIRSSMSNAINDHVQRLLTLKHVGTPLVTFKLIDFNESYGLRIVSAPPRILKMISTFNPVMATQKYFNEALGIDVVHPFIAESERIFVDGTLLVRCLLSPENTAYPIVLPDANTDKWFESINYSTSLVSHESSNRFMTGILKTILMVADSCDVIIQSPELVNTSELMSAVSPFDIIASQQYLKDSYPHIVYSIIRHQQAWFKKFILERLSSANVVIGERKPVTVLNMKKHADMWCHSDSLAATLHRIYMDQLESTKVKPADILAMGAAIMDKRGDVSVSLGHLSQMYETYFPIKTGTTGFLFAYILSPKLKESMFMRHINIMTDCGVFSTYDIAYSLDMTASSIGASDRDLSRQVVDRYKRIGLSDFYHAVVCEVFHANVNVTLDYGVPNESDLFSIFDVLDVIVFFILFPATARNEAHQLGGRLFSALDYFIPEEMSNFVSAYGYSMVRGEGDRLESIHSRDEHVITYEDYHNGITHSIFRDEIPQRYRMLTRLRGLLNPGGELLDMSRRRSAKFPDILDNAPRYCPWTYAVDGSRSIGGPLVRRIHDVFLFVNTLLMQTAQRVPKSVSFAIGNMLSRTSGLLTSLAQCLHFEGALMFRQLLSLFHNPISLYKGDPRIRPTRLVGLQDSGDPRLIGFVSVPFHVNLNSGVGVWMIYSLQGLELRNRQKGYGYNHSGVEITSGDIRWTSLDPNEEIRYYRGMLLFGEKISKVLYGTLRVLDPDSVGVPIWTDMVRGLFKARTMRVLAQQIAQMYNVGIDDIFSHEFFGKTYHHDLRMLRPIISYMNPRGGVIIDDVNPLTYELDFNDPYYVRKLNVAVHSILGKLSPVFQFNKGVILSKRFHSNLSPTHILADFEGQEVIEQDHLFFSTTVVDTYQVITMTILDDNNEEIAVFDRPNAITARYIRLTNPSLLQPDAKRFLAEAVFDGALTIELPNYVYVLRIQYPESRPTRPEVTISSIYEVIDCDYGAVNVVSVMDTTYSPISTRFMISQAAYIQYLHFSQFSDNSILASSIYAREGATELDHFDLRNWIAGDLDGEGVPSIENVDKVNSGIPNFNNPFKYFTSHAVFDVPKLHVTSYVG